MQLLTHSQCAKLKFYVLYSSKRYQTNTLVPQSTHPYYSELAGPEGLNLCSLNLDHYIRFRSRKNYYKTALAFKFEGRTFTYGKVRKNADALARALIACRIRPADTILALHPPSSELYFLQLAAAKIGVILILLPESFATPEKLRKYLNQFQPRLLFAREKTGSIYFGGGKESKSTPFRDILYEVLPELGYTFPGHSVQWIQSHEFPFLQGCIFTGGKDEGPCITNFTQDITSDPLPVWGSFSYYENQLRRHGLLLHGDDPVLALYDPFPHFEDKPFVVYSHRNCMNAGKIFSAVLNVQPNTRIAVLPYQHVEPVGAIVSFFAAFSSGSTMVFPVEELRTREDSDQLWSILHQMDVHGVVCRRKDFELLLRLMEESPRKLPSNTSRWIAIFENASEKYLSVELLQKAHTMFGMPKLYVFRGTTESCGLLSFRTFPSENFGVLPHTQIKVVGDIGTVDARILARENRGNLKLHGPHVSPCYYSRAGLMTELVDERGWVSTTRDGVIHLDGTFFTMEAQIY